MPKAIRFRDDGSAQVEGDTGLGGTPQKLSIDIVLDQSDYNRISSQDFEVVEGFTVPTLDAPTTGLDTLLGSCSTKTQEEASLVDVFSDDRDGLLVGDDGQNGDGSLFPSGESVDGSGLTPNEKRSSNYAPENCVLGPKVPTRAAPDRPGERLW